VTKVFPVFHTGVLTNPYRPDLPPFELSKTENHFQKAEIDRNFIVRKQKKSRKYVFDTK
jgi:hypothetical protein